MLSKLKYIRTNKTIKGKIKGGAKPHKQHCSAIPAADTVKYWDQFKIKDCFNRPRWAVIVTKILIWSKKRAQ